MALVHKDAALMVRDVEAVEKLIPTASELLQNTGKISTMEKNAAALAKTDAAQTIADEAYKLVK
jgi:UDP-N-acetylglucosamine--N-acetylmuramyl-(pentapeptide) pyrophosphoryl-undecaprenol N-acetylglucosamine transferase